MGGESEEAGLDAVWSPRPRLASTADLEELDTCSLGAHRWVLLLALVAL